MNACALPWKLVASEAGLAELLLDLWMELTATPIGTRASG